MTTQTTRVIGLIKLLDPAAFEIYRAQVGATVEAFGGKVLFRGVAGEMPWNDLGCAGFDAVVEIEFPDQDSAHAWAHSPAYQKLLDIRRQAMQLTLFFAH